MAKRRPGRAGPPAVPADLPHRRDEYLGDELVFRGGAYLHKLYLHPARRYSEDLDCVRRTAGGIGQVTKAISDIGANLGYEVRTEMSAQPKVYLRHTAESGTTRKIKVEVNTHEGSPDAILEHPLTRRWVSYWRPGSGVRDRAGR